MEKGCKMILSIPRCISGGVGGVGFVCDDGCGGSADGFIYIISP